MQGISKLYSINALRDYFIVYLETQEYLLNF